MTFYTKIKDLTVGDWVEIIFDGTTERVHVEDIRRTVSGPQVVLGAHNRRYTLPSIEVLENVRKVSK